MKLLKNEKGIALIMVLVLSVVILAIIAGLVYMITSGTQISGMQKRYKTALEAGVGGVDITYQIIGLRGEITSINSFKNSMPSFLNLDIVTPNTCITRNITDCTDIGSYTGIAAKSNLPTMCWSGCDFSQTIDPLNNPTSYDISLELPGILTTPTYNVYAKIVDTVLGNSGGDEGLLKSGVVSANAGEVTVMSIPYLYTIEVDAENAANPSERAKLSILYQY
jgi:hypothetical protein